MNLGKVMTWSRDGKIVDHRGVYDSKYMNGNFIAILSTSEPVRFLLLEMAQPYQTLCLACKVLLTDGRVGWLWSAHIEELTE